uniref:DUF868 domain-containing protein n=1 Tax=Leersia perrieri TaxID=77586 RepID=A0A0D9XWX4_9ORYZ
MVSASSLLLPSSVRDFASCISDGAAACTVPSSTRISSSSSSTLSVSFSYHVKREEDECLLLRLTWAHSPLGPTLSFSASARQVLVRRRKGSCSVPSGDAAADVPPSPPLALFWDLTAARYDAAASPEPVSGYYVVVAVDSAEVVLAVGDMAADFVRTKFDQIRLLPTPPFSRGERVVLSSLPAAAAAEITHTARARFAEGGAEHEVTVGCSPGGDELWVSIDGKRAVQARRLRWNFRGNQTVFVDGEPVDVMWDLHGWCFGAGAAVVMLRARTALESRLWLDDEAAAPGFSLLVQAFKSPP